MVMQIQRRQVLKAVAAASLCAGTRLATAQQLSPGGIKFSVGFPAGGIGDGVARIMATLMTKDFGTIIVENRVGASGQIAADFVRRSPPDGVNVLLTPLNMLTLVPKLYKKPMYDGVKDFMSVSAVCNHSFALAVPGSSNIRTVSEFVAWCKANPDLANFGSPGAGTSPHFLGIVLGRALGVPLNHVPYKGVAPAIQDLIGAQVGSVVQPLPTMIEHHRAGKLRILAVTNSTRVSSLPDVPTFTELNIKGLNYTEWFGLFVAATTPLAVAHKIETSAKQAVATQEFKEVCKRLELVPLSGDSESLRNAMAEDARRWTELVGSTGISLES